MTPEQMKAEMARLSKEREEYRQGKISVEITLGKFALKLDEANKQAEEYRRLLWVIVRNNDALQLHVPNKDLAGIPPDAELLKWNEPLFDAVILKAICKTINQPGLATPVIGKPVGAPSICMVQTGCLGGSCGKLLPCEDHAEKRVCDHRWADAEPGVSHSTRVRCRDCGTLRG